MVAFFTNNDKIKREQMSNSNCTQVRIAHKYCFSFCTYSPSYQILESVLYLLASYIFLFYICSFTCSNVFRSALFQICSTQIYSRKERILTNRHCASAYSHAGRTDQTNIERGFPCHYYPSTITICWPEELRKMPASMCIG